MIDNCQLLLFLRQLKDRELMFYKNNKNNNNNVRLNWPLYLIVINNYRIMKLCIILIKAVFIQMLLHEHQRLTKDFYFIKCKKLATK